MFNKVDHPWLRALRIALLVLLASLGMAADAQDQEQEREDRGFLQGLIEDNLSTEGRDVRIEGFRGVLSSEATLDKLTIADEDGIWLTVTDVTLDWSRSALLTGRLSVTEFSAEEIILERLPKPQEGPDVPEPESTGFSLPDLPVAVNIEKIAAKKVVLGEPILGEELSLSLEGSLQLDDGEGSATLDVSRLDRSSDFVSLEASFSNADRVLGIDLTVTEAEGGLASKLMGIPGNPSFELTVKGNAPLDDFTAEIALDTDGERRLGGTVTIQSPSPDPETPDAATPTRFAADIRGDVAPIFAPDYRDFFGRDVALVVEGSKPADGGLTIDTFTLDAAALELAGTLQIGPDNWPERFDLTGTLASKDGAPVLLPLSGPRTTLDTLDLALRYDRARGDDWRLTLDASGLEREELGLRRIELTGGGTLSQGDPGQPGRVDGALDYRVQDLDLTDPALARAIGENISGDVDFEWRQGTPFRLTALTLNGADYALDGSAEIANLTDPETPLRLSAKLDLVARDLARFAELAGTDLGGAAEVTLDAGMVPAEGRSNLRVTGTARDLALGQPRIDPLLDGETQLFADLRRGPDGTFIEKLTLDSPLTNLTANAAWKSEGSRAELALNLSDMSVIDSRLDGAASLLLNADQAETTPDLWNLRLSATGPGDALLTANGTVELREEFKPGTATLDANLVAGNLSPYAGIAGRPLRGSVDLSVAASGDIEARIGEATATMAGTDLAIGIEAVDTILRGDSTARVEAARDATGTITVTTARVTSPRIDATGQGALAADGSGRATLDLTGQNLAIGNPQVDPLLRGTTTLDASLERAADGTITIKTADLDNPQISADASGTLGTDGSSSARFDARLANVALLAPEFSGPATASGTIRGDNGGYVVDADATGPAGMTVSVSGRIGSGGALNLAATGQAPLALANPFISPRSLSGVARFDLRIDGPPALSSVSGSVTTRGAGVALPNLRLGLDDVNGNIDLRGGGAQVDLTAAVSTGGQIAVNGRVGLEPPFQSDLAVELRRVGITDPGLYTTTADGRITFNGPATGGASIAGTINLGEVKVQIPDGALTSGAKLPGLKHVNEPADVRRTRAFAEFIEQGEEGSAIAASGPSYPLDIRINAPARIFVRGRGLDAELGGGLHLRGTSRNIIPEGQFDLIRGRLDILGKRLDLTEGYLRMQGSFVPYIYLVAQTDAGDVDVFIVVEGPASEPDITFSSQPELPDDQILSQLIFGRDISQISAFQALQLASAVATLAGRGGDGVVGKLRKGFGLDDLDVTTGPNDETQLKAGKYLSENLYSEVEVDSEGQSQINLNLQINKNLKAKGSFGADGDSGLGIFFEKDY